MRFAAGHTLIIFNQLWNRFGLLMPFRSALRGFALARCEEMRLVGGLCKNQSICDSTKHMPSPLFSLSSVQRSVPLTILKEPEPSL